MPHILLLLAASISTFQGVWGGPQNDFAYDLTTTPTGFLLVGRTDSWAGSSSDAWLLSVDASGDTLWSRRYGGYGPDWAYSVIPVSAGGYLATGRFGSTTSGDLDGWLIRIDASGDTLWTGSYGGTGSQTFFSSIEAPGGGFISTGLMAGTGFDLWVLAVDSGGGFLWQSILGGSADDCGYGIAPGSDGFVVAGQTLSYGAGDGDLWLIRFGWDGDSLASAIIGGPSFDYPWCITAMPSGGYAVSSTSRSYGAGSYDFWIARLGADLGLQWAEAYGYKDDDWCYNCAPAGDGLAVTGMRNVGGHEAWLLNLDASGDTLWTRTYDTPGLANRGLGVVQAPDGGFALCGGLADSTDEDFWLVKTDAAGYCPETGIGDDEGSPALAAFSVTPNPAHGAFSLSIPGHDGSPLPIEIYDAAGRLMASSITPQGPAGATGVIDPWAARKLPAGVYIVRLPTLALPPSRLVILTD